jgi:hypothetical protein
VAPPFLEKFYEGLRVDLGLIVKVAEGLHIHLVMNDRFGGTYSHTVAAEVTVVFVGQNLYSPLLLGEAAKTD